jgi:hypothetical protein
MMSGHYDPAEVITLAREIMRGDVEAYGRQFPAYRDDPVRETVQAGQRMAMDDDFARQYEMFVRDMVYGEPVAFKDAVATIANLIDRLN